MEEKKVNNLHIEAADSSRRYSTPYSEKFEETRFVEKINVDPINNVYKKFDSTSRENQSIFYNGFIKYDY